MEAAEASFPCPRCTTLVVPARASAIPAASSSARWRPAASRNAVAHRPLRRHPRLHPLIFNEDPNARGTCSSRHPRLDGCGAPLRRHGEPRAGRWRDGHVRRPLAMSSCPRALLRRAAHARCAAAPRPRLPPAGRRRSRRALGVHSARWWCMPSATISPAGSMPRARGSTSRRASNRPPNRVRPGSLPPPCGWRKAMSRPMRRACGCARAPEPVEVHRLAAVDPRRSRLQIGSAKGYAPFVSRAAELSALASAYRRSAGGEGTGVVLVGDAGCGKSRVVHEFLAELENGHHRVLRAHCQPYDAGTALAPLAGLVRSHFGIAPEDGTAEAQDRILQGLRHAGTAMEASAPPCSPPSAAARRRRAGAASPRPAPAPAARGLRRTVPPSRGGGAAHPHRRDLPLGDGETLAVLDRVAEACPIRGRCCCPRPSAGIHPSAGRAGQRAARRAPGPGGHARPGAPASRQEIACAPPRPACWRAYRRQPLLFLEECFARAGRAGCAASAEAGAYSLVADDRWLDLPDTVRSVIASRIDRLPSGDKQVPRRGHHGAGGQPAHPRRHHGPRRGGGARRARPAAPRRIAGGTAATSRSWCSTSATP